MLHSIYVYIQYMLANVLLVFMDKFVLVIFSVLLKAKICVKFLLLIFDALLVLTSPWFAWEFTF